MTLPFDPNQTAEQIVAELATKGQNPNVCFPNLIIIDSMPLIGQDGYKVYLDAKYPSGKPIKIDAFKWNDSLNKSILKGTVWQR